PTFVLSLLIIAWPSLFAKPESLRDQVEAVQVHSPCSTLDVDSVIFAQRRVCEFDSPVDGIASSLPLSARKAVQVMNANNPIKMMKLTTAYPSRSTLSCSLTAPCAVSSTSTLTEALSRLYTNTANVTSNTTTTRDLI